MLQCYCSHLTTNFISSLSFSPLISTFHGTRLSSLIPNTKALTPLTRASSFSQYSSIEPCMLVKAQRGSSTQATSSPLSTSLCNWFFTVAVFVRMLLVEANSIQNDPPLGIPKHTPFSLRKLPCRAALPSSTTCRALASRDPPLPHSVMSHLPVLRELCGLTYLEGPYVQQRKPMQTKDCTSNLKHRSSFSSYHIHLIHHDEPSSHLIPGHRL